MIDIGGDSYYVPQCYQATTTAYPKPTDSGGLKEECESTDDYEWIISVKFRISLDIDPTSTSNRVFILNSCKRAFFRTILMILMEWMEDFCFDLIDLELTINEYTESNSRCLLEREYEIDAGFSYNDDLQDVFFSNETISGDFSSIFGDELKDVLIAENIINSNTTGISITISSPEEYKDDGDDDDGHRVEGALLNGVSIMAIVDVLLFLACLLYIIRESRPRINEEGDIDRKDAKKNHKLPYWVAIIEIIDSIIHWIFAIVIIIHCA